jgi:hypothetical protein
MVAAALVAGAAAGASNVVSTAVIEAYQGLKTLALGRLRGGGLSDDDGRNLIAAAADQQAERGALTEELARVGVDEPMVETAQRLLELLEQQRSKFVVDASQAKGLIVGDHGVQHNTFN